MLHAKCCQNTNLSKGLTGENWNIISNANFCWSYFNLLTCISKAETSSCFSSKCVYVFCSTLRFWITEISVFCFIDCIQPYLTVSNFLQIRWWQNQMLTGTKFAKLKIQIEFMDWEMVQTLNTATAFAQTFFSHFILHIEFGQNRCENRDLFFSSFLFICSRLCFWMWAVNKNRNSNEKQMRLRIVWPKNWYE